MPQIQDPAVRECHGSLPFGAENCVCDGAAIGEAAGLSACVALFQECGSPLIGFSLLDSVQQACDSLAASACVDTGRQLAMMHPRCAEMLLGAGTCDPAKASAIFEQNLGQSCEPLCPECGKTDDTSESPSLGPPHDDTVNDPLPSSCEDDGELVAQASAVAACSATFSACTPLSPFSAPEDPDSRPRACSEAAYRACANSAPDLALRHEPCARLLFDGTPFCPPEMAREIFEDAVDLVCQPLLIP